MTGYLPHLGVVPEKFWARVDTSGNCWEWLGTKTSAGYGNCYIPEGQTTGVAHRVAYALLIGVPADDMQLDHLCRNRACVNPDHLEPVTAQENVLRSASPPSQFAKRDRCAEGHPFVIRKYNGKRFCRECSLNRQRERRALRKELIHG